MSTYILLENATTDGNYTAVSYDGSGDATLQITGAWDGATVTIQGALAKLGFNSPVNNSYTDDVITEFSMGKGRVRAVISGAGASTSLNAVISD